MVGRVRSPWFLAVALAVASGGGCSRVNPAFRGDLDGGRPDTSGATEGGTGDGAVVDGEIPDAIAPPADGACVGGTPCTKPGEPCLVGTTVCATEGPICDGATPAPNGSSCGIDKVCKAGSCISCAAGTVCASPDGACQVGSLDCSTGVPTCTGFHTAPNGTTCATGICYQGDCTTPSCGGTNDTLCDLGMVCDRTGCGTPPPPGVCVTPPATCTSTYAPVCGCDGKTYPNDCVRLRSDVPLDHPGVCANTAEDCYNGFDDNGDGLVDCEDPSCVVTSLCTAPPPSGWIGIGWLDPDTVVTCPPSLAEVNLYETANLNAATLACTCECGTATAHCGIDLTCYAGDTGCNNAGTSFTVTGCQTVSLPQGATSCLALAPRLVGSCPATTKTVRPTVVWPATGRACVREAGGYCTGGTLQCVPRPPAGAVGPCVVHTGDVACPGTGPYTAKHLYYDGKTNDTRACTACSECTASGTCRCDTMMPECGVSIYSDSLCQSSNPTTVPAGGMCMPITNSGSTSPKAQPVGLLPPESTQCVPGTSTVTGTITPTTKLTICCIP
jgi:hypothetical protein